MDEGDRETEAAAMTAAPACRDCRYFHVGMYTYHCTAPQIAKTSIDPITGQTMVTGQYPEKLREDIGKCGPEGQWFEAYPYVLPKIAGASPGLKATILTAPLFGFVLLGAGLAAYHHTVWLCVLALLTFFCSLALLAMMHERDDPP
jgi:hypothetical protein